MFWKVPSTSQPFLYWALKLTFRTYVSWIVNDSRINFGIDTGKFAQSVAVLTSVDFRKMAIKLACLNARPLRDLDMTFHLLLGLFIFGVGVSGIHESHFVCDIEGSVLPSDCCLFTI